MTLGGISDVTDVYKAKDSFWSDVVDRCNVYLLSKKALANSET